MPVPTRLLGINCPSPVHQLGTRRQYIGQAMATLWFDEIPTPLGALVAIANSAGALTHLLFAAEIDQRAAFAQVRRLATTRSAAPFLELRHQLRAYFDGRALTFTVPMVPHGTTFQRQVWDALVKIEPGTTKTYGELAHALGRPNGARAVGAANGRNPISVLIPCHRLVGANGTLTGYAGGLANKRWLLRHEAAMRSGATA